MTFHFPAITARRYPVMLALFVAFADTAGAQTQAATRMDSLFARARQLVTEGNGAAGRALVDSVLGAASEGTSEYADALYWRAVLAESGETAQHDYLKVAIEYPASERAPDALLRLAQLELARGEREAGIRHLERLTRDYASSPQAPYAFYWRARTLLETNSAANMSGACRSISLARATVNASDVELRNQIDFYARRCEGVDTNAVAVAKEAPGPAPDTRTAPSVAAGRFAVQVGAFRRKQEADALSERLVQRGMVSRVVSAGEFHRVWVGRFATRSEANSAMQEFKRAGIDGFVVEEK